MAKLSAQEIRRLMRAHSKTIRGLAAAMNVPMTRVRYVRERGVSGDGFVTDWLEAIRA